MASSVDAKKIASELKGNTLRCYWAMLNSEKGVIGVRELQRKLGFSSPALATYHLNNYPKNDKIRVYIAMSIFFFS